MESVEAKVFNEILAENTAETHILYIKANENDDVIGALEQSNRLTKDILFLLNAAHFLSLDSVQQGHMPDVKHSEDLYVLCNHGYLSELAGLYLEVAGFEKVFNVSGGLEALVKLK